MAQKRKVMRALFDNIETLTTEQILSSEVLKKLIVTETPKAISHAHKNKGTYASIFEINNSKFFIEIHKKDWLAALESCVVFNVEIEDYENCQEINALIQEIKSSKRSPKIKIKSND
jgi:cyclophilin family peptidyl-prolyl cis-trans isomerase